MAFDAGYKYRFYPSPEQANLLNRTFGCVRVVYNRARAERETAWKERKESCGYSKTSALLTQWKKDPELAWLRKVSSVPLQQCLRHLDAAYKNFFRKTAKYPGFRSKHDTQTAEFTKQGFSYRNGKLTLAKIDAPLSIIWSRALPSHPSTVTIIKETDGRWYVTFRVLKPTVKLQAGAQIGIDLGLTDFAILSTGEKIANPRHLSKRQKRLARLQRHHSKKQKGSNNREKARIKVARAHSKVRDCRSDFLHKLSTRLIRENQTICLENLNIKGMARGRLSKSIADVGWGAFVQMLRYKAVWYGRELVKIDRFYPSTKTCGVCGTTGHILPLSTRAWDCPDCGVHHDRDVNAARMILTAGLAELACGEDVRPLAA
jgi:putative transposase